MFLYELQHDKTSKMTCVSSEDSDQPGHPPNLIRVFTVRMKKAWVLSYLLIAQRRLWSDWAVGQADLSSLGAHTILLVLSCGSSYFDSREHEWFKKDLPAYLFPTPTDHDASIIDVDVVREVCDVSYLNVSSILFSTTECQYQMSTFWMMSYN